MINVSFLLDFTDSYCDEARTDKGGETCLIGGFGVMIESSLEEDCKRTLTFTGS
jgi:hypothetical protein